ncbi:MAG: MalY/PatB family protein [Mobilitalea sp.]
MMQYDFETVVKRKNMGSHKWDQMIKINSKIEDSIVPFSVADMELKNAPEIVEGLKDYLDNTILGYTGATDTYYDSVIHWMESKHHFSPKKEWFVEAAGVVPALRQMIAAFTEPGDAVLIMTPVYYPFKMVIESNQCNVVATELIKKNNTYDIDFNDFEEKAKKEEVKLLILCSPHNPIGRIWTKEELLRISEICLDNGVFILADEIHFDIILPGYQFVSMGTFDEKYLNNCAICTAPSKTFNLAGFQTSNIFISNKDMRDKVESAKGYHSLNIMGYKACEIAYTKCDKWLEELLVVIDTNKKYIEDFMASKLPKIKVFELQGTYLQWLDFNALGMDCKELENFMQQEAQIFFDEGYIFGDGGCGFERINIACPTWVIREAMDRLYTALLRAGKTLKLQ